MSEPTRRPLPPGAARTLYNLADAWLPPGPDGCGGGDVDCLPALERALGEAGPSAARRLRAGLALLEWRPLLTLRAGRGLSWLPRERRRALLARWERGALAPGRRALARLRRRVEGAVAETARERAPHSRGP